MDYAKQLRVLVLEPSPYLGRILRDTLEHNICVPAIFLCRTSAEAEQYFTETRVNLLIVNVDKGCPDGIVLIERIRQGLGNIPEDLPIISMTATPTRQLVERLRDLGVNEILALPMTPKTLADRVKSVFEHPRDWVVSSDYVGPDRRRKKNVVYQGAERRDENDPSLLLTDPVEAPEDDAKPHSRTS